jgi:hypothetical protein
MRPNVSQSIQGPPGRYGRRPSPNLGAPARQTMHVAWTGSTDPRAQIPGRRSRILRSRMLRQCPAMPLNPHNGLRRAADYPQSSGFPGYRQIPWSVPVRGLALTSHDSRRIRVRPAAGCAGSGWPGFGSARREAPPSRRPAWTTDELLQHVGTFRPHSSPVTVGDPGPGGSERPRRHLESRGYSRP